MNNSIFNASMVLWKKKLYNNISKDFLKYKFCGDWLFWVGLARHGSLHASGKTLNYFRKHKNDISGNATKNGLELVETIAVLNSMYEEKLINDQEFNKGLKRLFKKYWTQKAELNVKLRRELKKAFQNPASSAFNYNRMILSVIWHDIVHK